MENRVLQYAKEIFKTEDIEINHRLMGGMSNYTYVIKVEGKLYTLRIPGEYADYFVNRAHELRDLKLLSKLNITNETIYFSLENGVKVSKYYEGRSLNELKVRPYKLVSELLHKIHTSSLRCEEDYDPFGRLALYESHLEKLGLSTSIGYAKTKANLLKFKDYLNSQEKVLCHNDSQPSNFIISEDNQLIIVDFEFVGNNDCLYDIACFGNIVMDDAWELLKAYFNEITDDILLRFHLWRAFQCLQWYNVALFKDLKGMSETLKLDFKYIASKYLEKADENLGKCLEE